MTHPGPSLTHTLLFSTLEQTLYIKCDIDAIHQLHNAIIIFQVKVNGTDYQPSIASNNKKLAKAQCATVCLQELGLVPRNST